MWSLNPVSWSVQLFLLSNTFVKLNPKFVYGKFIKFYCNYWITKKNTLLEFIKFFKKCKEIIDTDEEIQSIIWHDARHSGLSEEELLKIFNKPHYCYHPFVCEKLAWFFFHGKKFI